MLSTFKRIPQTLTLLLGKKGSKFQEQTFKYFSHPIKQF